MGIWNPLSEGFDGFPVLRLFGAKPEGYDFLRFALF